MLTQLQVEVKVARLLSQIGSELAEQLGDRWQEIAGLTVDITRRIDTASGLEPIKLSMITHMRGDITAKAEAILDSFKPRLKGLFGEDHGVVFVGDKDSSSE